MNKQELEGKMNYLHDEVLDIQSTLEYYAMKALALRQEIRKLKEDLTSNEA